jgi:ribosomal protein L11 methylase PrmA
MRELVLHSSESQAEAISDALLEAGVLSVSVEDADRDTDAEQPLFGEPGTEPDVQARMASTPRKSSKVSPMRWARTMPPH